MTAVIAVAQNKGGVAKTTTVLSLGGSLAEMGLLVLLIDMDPQAHLTLSLGVNPESVRRTVGDVLLGHSSPVAASRETDTSGLDLLPANQELVILEKVLYKRPGYEYRLKESLDQMDPGLYDVVLIDCPPSVGTLTINGLSAADLLLIPVPCEYYAVRSLRQMLELVSLVRRKTNPSLRYRLLVTMFDIRNKVHRTILDQLRFRFPGALLRTIIQVDTRLRESPAFGLPVTRYAPRTRAARQYRGVAQELARILSLDKDKRDSRMEISLPVGVSSGVLEGGWRKDEQG
ncbi:MAG TPA: ParA family protein [Thermoflexia bacterium]|jgi:chromosome partitioning protein|nr:ParA family protein [Thermoflexia bacterium]